jgi:hypothetical protein
MNTKKSGAILLFFAGFVGLSIGKASEPLDPESLRRLARVTQGLPEEELKPYVGDKNATAVLIAMLEDDREKPAWDNVVTMIGYVSPFDAGLANRLINYLESPFRFRDCPADSPDEFRLRDGSPKMKVLMREDYQPKLNVLVSLGYMLSKGTGSDWLAPDRHAVGSYLHSGDDSAFWVGKVRWTGSEAYMTPAYRDDLLSKNSKIALQLVHGQHGDRR